jgi:hypothetical protein
MLLKYQARFAQTVWLQFESFGLRRGGKDLGKVHWHGALETRGTVSVKRFPSGLELRHEKGLSAMPRPF